MIDTLPALADVVSPIPDSCDLAGFVLTCSGSLSAGDSQTIVVLMAPTAPGVMLNSASVVPQDLLLDPNPTNNLDAVTTTVTPGGTTTPPPTPSPSPSPTPAPTEPTESPTTTSTETPVGGVDTGAGGTASGGAAPVLIGLGLAAGLGILLAIRRRVGP